MTQDPISQTPPHPIAQVQNVIIRQKECSDNQDDVGLEACYSLDFSQSVSTNGAAAVATSGRDAVVKGIVSRREANGTRLVHFLGPASIELTGADGATASYMCLYLVRLTGVVAGWGMYQDQLVLEEGAWRLQKRTLQATFL